MTWTDGWKDKIKCCQNTEMSTGQMGKMLSVNLMLKLWNVYDKMLNEIWNTMKCQYSERWKYWRFVFCLQVTLFLKNNEIAL